MHPPALQVRGRLSHRRMYNQEYVNFLLISHASSEKVPISTSAIVGAAVGSSVFVSLLIGIGIFLCLRRRRTKKKVRGPPIDLGADEQTQESRPSRSNFAPFEYRLGPSSSPREEVSDYGRGSSPGARVNSSLSSQALLSGWDPTSPSNNTQSTYSTYTRDTPTSATQWGETPSARNGSLVPTPLSPLTPPVPPIREKRRLLATNAPEIGASSPTAVNRTHTGDPAPPPYTPR